jgi:hypothetical protein
MPFSFLTSRIHFQSVRKHLLLLLEHTEAVDLRDTATESIKRFIEVLEVVKGVGMQVCRVCLFDFDQGGLFIRRARWEAITFSIGHFKEEFSDPDTAQLLVTELIKYFVTTTHELLREECALAFEALVRGLHGAGEGDGAVKAVLLPLVKLVGSKASGLAQRLACVCLARAVAVLPPLAPPHGLDKLTVSLMKRMGGENAGALLHGDNFQPISSLVTVLGAATPASVVNDGVCHAIKTLAGGDERSGSMAIALLETFGSVSERDGLDQLSGGPLSPSTPVFLTPFRPAIEAELARHRHSRHMTIRKGVASVTALLGRVGCAPAEGARLRGGGGGGGGPSSPSARSLASSRHDRATKDATKHYRALEEAMIAEVDRNMNREIERIRKKRDEEVEAIKRQTVRAINTEVARLTAAAKK